MSPGWRLKLGDGTVCLWSSSTGALIFRFEGYTRAVRVVAFSADGSRIASNSDENTIGVWSTDPGNSALVIEGP